MMSTTVFFGEGRYWPRLAALSLAMLLPSLGTSITNVALPTLARSFDATMADVQWVVIAYLLSVTSLIVGAGRLGNLVGRRRLVLAGMALFSAASVICALSPSLSVLIAARAVQGAGGAVIMTLTVAMVGDLSRNIGLIWGASAMAALYAMGPRISGGMGLGADQASGLGVTFAVSASLAVISLGAVLWGRREVPEPGK